MSRGNDVDPGPGEPFAGQPRSARDDLREARALVNDPDTRFLVIDELRAMGYTIEEPQT